MEKLRIALVQADLKWEDAAGNRDMFGQMLEGLKDKTDLIILPEMFTTGFSMNSRRLAETMEGETLLWMKEKAGSLGAVVTGSVIIRESNTFYNRLIWMRPDGSFAYYDKRHLFRMGGEHQFYSAGQEKMIIDLKGWRICPLICYDLRFPVWSRNRGDLDMILYVANWPASRRDAWKILLKARAIENQVYVAGVNRTGTDGEGTRYMGDTQLVNPKGEVVTGFDLSYPGITITEISPADLEELRKKFPVGDDADEFTLKI